MCYSHEELIINQKVEGVKVKITHQVESLLMTELELQKGALLPEHMHKSDHSGYLLQGRIRMYIDGLARDLVQGDSWYIAKNTVHYTEAFEDAVVIEVFNHEHEDLQYYQQACKAEG